MKATITARHVYPPIPVRVFDWCAFWDGTEEAGPFGWGESEAAAISDLLENYERPVP